MCVFVRREKKNCVRYVTVGKSIFLDVDSDFFLFRGCQLLFKQVNVEYEVVSPAAL